MKCLVTGATGFVGIRLVKKLVEEGHSVQALVRPGSEVAPLKASNVDLIEGDMAWTHLFARHGENADVVFHLAGVTHSPRWDDYRNVNQRGMKSLVRGLDRCEFHGRVVYLSSLAAGGPVAGPEAARIEEDSDHPVSEYGRTKRGAERLLRDALTSRASWTILRAGKIYGPGQQRLAGQIAGIQRTGILPSFNPKTSFQWTHVDDMVDGLLRAAFSPDASRKMYYVTDRTTWTLPGLASLLSELLARKVRVVRVPRHLARCSSTMSAFLHRSFGIAPFSPDPGRLPDYQGGCWAADPTKFEDELGWQCHHNLPAALAECIRGFQRDGKL
ncbi:MAG: NAD-dependent epimerase/dehydratase family protein [Candidatus Sumerlaeia bacterium]|nr:NAD-dependent epimerase/dehydratase family protein [Candidatus Sumerlaeia bacterium]